MFYAADAEGRESTRLRVSSTPNTAVTRKQCLALAQELGKSGIHAHECAATRYVARSSEAVCQASPNGGRVPPMGRLRALQCPRVRAVGSSAVQPARRNE